MPVKATTVTDFPAIPSNLQAIMSREVANAAQFEERLGALQDALTASLKEAQEVVTLYNRRKALVKEYISNANQRDNLNVPMIRRATDKTLDVIHDVEWRLPSILSQLLDIKRVYELGRKRAQMLQTDLEWMIKSDSERWRSILLGKSPLSAQQVKREWKRLFQRLTFLALFFCALILYFVWRTSKRTI